MSHWDGKNVVRWPFKPDEDHPGWTWIDCGCCNGMQWGEYPVECESCGQSGMVARHDKSGALALYPGGPFTGREEKAVDRRRA